MDYYHISAEDLGKDARVPLVCAGDSAEVFFDLALEMVSTIREAQRPRREDRLHLARWAPSATIRTSSRW